MESREILVRPELPGDEPVVRAVLTRAFPTDAEARQVEVLRGNTDPQVSLVAVGATGAVVGHILFTPVEIRSGARGSSAMGLAPMAVTPEHQRTGIGGALVEAGLAACTALGERVVVVLGHPNYYPRFGFRPAEELGLYYGRPGPNPAFMVCEIERGALRGRSGQVVYHAAFDSL